LSRKNCAKIQNFLRRYEFFAAWQPVALVDFCATSNAKIPIIGAAFGVCKVKNRLIGDFLGFYMRSATNSWHSPNTKRVAPN
jgi:hypothetical protein